MGYDTVSVATGRLPAVDLFSVKPMARFWRVFVRGLPTVIVAASLLWAGATARAGAAAKLPNILVLLADDVDWRDFGCFGNEGVHTPNIDALARNGLLFRRAFLTAPQCSPTRISILSGKYPHATGAEDLSTPLPEGQVFVSTYLQRKGYFTGLFRKKHFGPNGDKQFEWYSPRLEAFGKFLDACGDRPFFGWVGFRDAHRGYQKGAFDPPHDPARVKVPPYLADTQGTREDLAMYYDEIARMDGNIGRFVSELKRRRLYEHTLIIFLGDNGMPFPRAKGTLYDAGVGTPLVMCWPGVIEPGGVYDDLVSVVDFAPTWLELAGIDKPADMQGDSLLDIIKDPSRPGRQYVFSERNWHDCDEHMRSVRGRRFKLIRNAYLDVPFGTPADVAASPSWQDLYGLKGQNKLTAEQLLLFRVPRPRTELYDVQADPWELHNLAGQREYANIVRELNSVLDRWIAKTGDFPPHRRRRGDTTHRNTGVRFMKEIPPLIE